MDYNRHNYEFWTINGKWLSYYGLTPMSDMADTIDSPADYKSLTTDENESIDGCIGLYTNRKLKKREFSLKFYFQYSSDNIVLARRVIDNLIDDLVNGYNSSGISILQTESKAYMIVLNKIDKVQNVKPGRYIITFNVIEVNPTNRTRQTLYTWNYGNDAVMSTLTSTLSVGCAVTAPGEYLVKKPDGNYYVSIGGHTRLVAVQGGTVYVIAENFS